MCVELPQEDVDFIGAAAGGWVDMRHVVILRCVSIGICVSPAPQHNKTTETMLCGGHSSLVGNEVGALLLFPATSN